MLAPSRRKPIGEKQRVIDDQELGVGDPPPGAVVETVVVRGACPPHAIAMVAGHFVPHLATGRKSRSESEPSPVCFDQAPIAGDRRTLLLGEQSRRAAQGILQPPQAEVIAAALGQHRGKLQRDDAGQERDVFIEQLLLEADGVGGDHHPPPRCALGPRPGRIEDRRHEVGETLAHPRPRLDHQVPPLLDRLGHRFGHRQLLRAVLVLRQSRGDASLRAQDFGGRKHLRSVPREAAAS